MNDAFRRWLADYAKAQQRLQRDGSVVAQLRGHFEVGRRISRDEMNAR